MEIICYFSKEKAPGKLTLKYGDSETTISKDLVEWALRNTSIKVRFKV